MGGGAWVFRTTGVFSRDKAQANRLNLTPANLQRVLTAAATHNSGTTKENGWTIIFADAISGPELKTEYIDSVSAVVFDVDWGNAQPLQDLLDKVSAAFSGLLWAWWETWQSRDDAPRFRIVLPLSEAVEVIPAARLWQEQADKLEANGFKVKKVAKKGPKPTAPCIDPTSKESSRLQLLPNAGRRWGLIPGALLDPNEITLTPEQSHKAVATDESIVIEASAYDLRITPTTAITLEDGTVCTLADVTADYIKAHARGTEPNKLRCTCPFAESGSYSAFVKLSHGLPLLTCTSANHSHQPNTTWNMVVSNGSANVASLEMPYPYSEYRGVLRAESPKESKDGSKSVSYRTVSYHVPMVTHVYREEETNDEWWKVQWKDRSHDQSLTLRRDQWGSAAKLGESAGRAGLDVNEYNKKELTKYLSDFLHHNQGKIPIQPVTSRMGWFENGFLLGRTWMNNPKMEQEYHELLTPSGDGRAQIVNALKAEGSAIEQMKALHALHDYPYAVVGLYASIASVLANYIDAMTFVLEWAAGTGTGKTTSSRAAQSIWGKPKELESSWDGTRVAMERDASFLSALPIFYDDTKTVAGAKNSMDPEWAIYRIVSGEGRRRGTPGGGTQHTAKWNLCMISTGEEPIYGSTQAGGARARLISIQEVPFGLASKESVAKVAAPIGIALSSNYGHIGPRIIKMIMAADKQKLIEQHTKFRAEYSNYLSGRHSVGDRIANHLALMRMSGAMLASIMGKEGLTINPTAVLLTVADHLIRIDGTAGEADPVTRSKVEFYQWCLARRANFWTADNKDMRLNQGPHGGWLGRWDGGDDWTEFFVTTDCLELFLREKKYQGSARLWAAQWAQMGYVSAKSEKSIVQQIRMAGGLVWVYKIKKESIA